MNFLSRFTATRLAGWLALAGFALLIFGAKLALIENGGTDLPLLDQWDAEAEGTLRPWLDGHLTLRDLFAPHNEHRLVTTKLYTLVLTASNGQWDGFVETTANAAVHTLCAVVLLLLAGRWLRGRTHVAFGVLLALIFGLPFAWENTLVGFQVQFYFLLLFSLLHLAFTLEADRCSWRWLAGQLCAALAVVSMASGFFSSVAVLVVLGFRLVRERRWTVTELVTATLSLGFVIAGWLMKSPAPNNAPLHVHSVGAFLDMFTRGLAWPCSASLPWLLLPAGWFLVHWLRRRPVAPGDALLLGLLVWGILQDAALAYGRGADGVFAPRYYDLLAFNAVLGFLLLARVTAGLVRPVALTVWLLLAANGLARESVSAWENGVVPTAQHYGEQKQYVRDFLRTGDPRPLQGKRWPEIPYPRAYVLLDRLKSPVAQLLPPSVRPPLVLSPPGAVTPTAVPASLPDPDDPVALSTWPAAGSTPFTWRSATQPATTLPVLRFRIAGDLGDTRHALHLVVRSAHGTVPVVPDAAPGLRWKVVHVVRPSGRWWIEATDADPDAWFAFTAPVELGRLTWIAEKLLKHCLDIIFAGCVLLVVGFGLGNINPTDLDEFRRRAASLLARLHSMPRPGRWLVAAGLLVLLKLWLVAAQPVVAIGWAYSDDRLFLTLADNILHGHWLGGYNYLTLAKGPMYSIWIAALSLVDFPLPLANHLLYLAGCILVVQALRSRLPSSAAAFALFAVLWWNPMTFDLSVLGRVLRQNLYTPAALLFFAGLIALETRRAARVSVRCGWGALLGVSAAVLWLTREETVWAVPGALMLLAAASWNSWRAGERLRPLLAPLVAAVAAAGAIVLPVCALNLSYYGWFGTVEFRAPEFISAYGALQRVKSSYELPYVPVTREAREKIYAVSPAFAELRSSLEGKLGVTWAGFGEQLTGRNRREREIAGGWFMWALRDAVFSTGHVHNARDALAFYARLAREVNAACDAGRLPARPRRDTFVPPWRPEFTARLPAELLRSLAYVVTFRDFTATPPPSLGADDLLALFRDLTHWRLSPSSDSPESSLTPPPFGFKFRIATLAWIGRAFSWLAPLLAAAALGILAAALWRFWHGFAPTYLTVPALAALAAVLAVILINTLVHVMSFPNRSAGAFAEAYPLLLLSGMLLLCEWWPRRRRET